jgi:hypothetical protein
MPHEVEDATMPACSACQTASHGPHQLLVRTMSALLFKLAFLVALYLLFFSQSPARP